MLAAAAPSLVTTHLLYRLASFLIFCGGYQQRSFTIFIISYVQQLTKLVGLPQT
jgi:hypothetical protein